MTKEYKLQNGTKTTEVVVYKTIQYDLFSLIPSNRPIYPVHLKRLKKLIAENNKLEQNPIRVTPSGKVLDGQHRLRAAEELSTPIFYFIDESKTSIPDIAMENWAVRRWSKRDHLNYWCEHGKEHYLALRDFLDKHDWMTISVAVAVCRGKQSNTYLGGAGREDFAMGRYRITDMSFGCKFAKAMGDFVAVTDVAKHKPFQTAISYLLMRKDYDHERMLLQLDKFGGKIKKVVDKIEYLRQLETIYNYRSREDNRVRFF
jgi:hypothetical protein